MERVIIDMDLSANKSKKEQLLKFLEDMHISFQINEEKISLEEYNRELEEAVERAKRGEFTTRQDLKNEISAW
jgi:hypothetical protein